MYVKKRMSLLLFAALAMVLFTACGRWDFSREAAKAANEAQNAVVFEASTTLAQSLKDALEDKVQTADVKAAMEADERLADLLGRLDVYAVEGDDAEAAAQTIADGYIKHISGRKSDGHIAMVKADNGWFYAAVVTTPTGGSGSGSGNGDDSSSTPEEKFTLESITVTQPSKVEYWSGENLATDGMKVTAIYKGDQGTVKENVDISLEDCEITPDSFTNDSDENITETVTVTYEGKTATFTVTVKPILLESIELLGYEETKYKVGDFFLSTGSAYERHPREELKLKLVYNNGCNEQIPLTEDMVREGGSLNAWPAYFFFSGQRNIVVTYTVDGKEYKTVPITVTVTE